MAAHSSSKVTLKLLIDTKTRRVLFAEAGKEFVDFLFALFSLPLGSVTKLLSTDNMVGCLGNLYKSIEDLSVDFIQPTQSKVTILNPKFLSCPAMNNTLLLPNHENNESAAKNDGYGGYGLTITRREIFVTDNPQAICRHCNQAMSYEAKFIDAAPKNVAEIENSEEDGGFVKGVVIYMVMDNLEVRPFSTISTITLLNEFDIGEVGSLQEKVVELGMAEGLKVLKASLHTKTVLTTVFLGP
ncbi:unnamed protein product [Linum tenue]|uniref:DUF674 domain-containing protein n=2 Tax=Linum tenue TaxID=586396 RepID=A0AAV0KVW9_9ROSI|nr:unnamed protein product [Linum tenue]